jgi:hypothetical protein
MSRGSVAGTVTDYGQNDRKVAVRVPVGSRILTCSYRADRFWGPPNRISTGPMVTARSKGREADRSTPTSAEVKKN